MAKAHGHSPPLDIADDLAEALELAACRQQVLLVAVREVTVHAFHLEPRKARDGPHVLHRCVAQQSHAAHAGVDVDVDAGRGSGSFGGSGEQTCVGVARDVESGFGVGNGGGELVLEKVFENQGGMTDTGGTQCGKLLGIRDREHRNAFGDRPAGDRRLAVTIGVGLHR